MDKVFEELDRGECLVLLAGERLGRLGVVVGGVPLVLPMQYALDGDRVVLRTNPGAKFTSAPLTHVSFEVDSVDFDQERGWSVLVTGTAEDISESIDERSEYLRTLPLAPWVPGEGKCWMTIIPRTITGRRVANG